VGTPHRPLPVELGPLWTIPNLKGGVAGREAAPNRRGAELAGFAPGAGAVTVDALLGGDAAAQAGVLVVCDSDFGSAAHAPEVIERLRRARFLAVLGWADTPLARAADVALPVATHVEKSGVFVNVQWRAQRFDAAFPPPGMVRPGVEVFAELLARFGVQAGTTPAAVFDNLAAELPAFAGLTFDALPATGAPLNVPQAAAELAAPAPPENSEGIAQVQG
jgi:predicted molibdopterin-dependent oxidoreductase YjgC